MKKAIIYCRVSSDKQEREGHGLEGQEKRCRDYAASKNYEVIKVFRDEGVSGSLTNRPAMQKLIQYLSDTRVSEVVIIFDDIKRLARNIEGHFALKAMLTKNGSTLESPSYSFEETPEGKLVETMFASMAEYERNANQTQVFNRMHARMQLGYWVLREPLGYAYIKHSVEGKLIHPVEPIASIIKEALEGFANGKFLSQEEVRQFLLQQKFPHTGKTIHIQRIKRILVQPLYAGIIAYPKWDIAPLQGRHQALITVETFERIQERLSGRAKKPFIRKSDHEDFPMRGFALCPECENAYTGSWSKGRNDRYAYYRCNNKQCSLHSKSIRKEVLEEILSNALKTIAPAQAIIDLVQTITLDMYQKQIQQREALVQSHNQEAKALKKQIELVTDKLIATTSATVQQALERKIEDLENQYTQIQQKIHNLNNHQVDFGTALEKVMSFVENPHQLWVNGDLRQKKLVQRLVFVKPVVIHPDYSIGTTDLSLPFKMLQHISSEKSHLVGPLGLEPRTNGL